jgi:ubiquinone/menaquinone biosynthesis C-methylase UbiE
MKELAIVSQEEESTNTYHELLTTLLQRVKRQVPGSEEETIKAIQLLSLDPKRRYKVAHLGCGTGATTLALAKRIQGLIIAVDDRPELLDHLQAVSESMSLSASIEVTSDDVDNLPIAPSSLDLIWSDADRKDSVFVDVIRHWHGLLKPEGAMVVTELIWLKEDRPQALVDYLETNYKDILTLEERLEEIEANGYEVLQGGVLSQDCHTTEYYQPLMDSVDGFIKDYPVPATYLVAANLKHEVSMYQRYNEYFGYAVLIARKR